jgi:hypothetical protein
MPVPSKTEKKKKKEKRKKKKETGSWEKMAAYKPKNSRGY